MKPLPYKATRRRLNLTNLSHAISGLAAVLFVAGCTPEQRDHSAAHPGFLQSLGQAPDKLSLHESTRAVPPISFKDGSGATINLEHFRGQAVLLNVWATWCAPCREEMPSLDNLQAALGGPQFKVVAVSIDQTGEESVRRFLQQIGIKHLELYIDESARAAFDLGAVGVPVTLLIDAHGHEAGRLTGIAKWDSPAMMAWLKTFIAAQSETR